MVRNYYKLVIKKGWADTRNELKLTRSDLPQAAIKFVAAAGVGLAFAWALPSLGVKGDFYSSWTFRTLTTLAAPLAVGAVYFLGALIAAPAQLHVEARNECDELKRTLDRIAKRSADARQLQELYDRGSEMLAQAQSAIPQPAFGGRMTIIEAEPPDDLTARVLSWDDAVLAELQRVSHENEVFMYRTIASRHNLTRGERIAMRVVASFLDAKLVKLRLAISRVLAEPEDARTEARET